MKVHYEDMGEVFKAPFRFLPYCPKCNAELGSNEQKCRKCGEALEWFDPYKKEAPDGR